MEATVSFLLILQKYISSSQKTPKWNIVYTLCLGNISRDFKIGNMKKTGLKGSVKTFLLIIMLLMPAIF